MMDSSRTAVYVTNISHIQHRDKRLVFFGLIVVYACSGYANAYTTVFFFCFFLSHSNAVNMPKRILSTSLFSLLWYETTCIPVQNVSACFFDPSRHPNQSKYPRSSQEEKKIIYNHQTRRQCVQSVILNRVPRLVAFPPSKISKHQTHRKCIQSVIPNRVQNLVAVQPDKISKATRRNMRNIQKAIVSLLFLSHLANSTTDSTQAVPIKQIKEKK